MTDRYENIRKALAMGPTPGPWGLKELPRDMQRDGYKFSISRRGLGCWIAKVTHEANGGSGAANAALIAACDPDTLRKLLDERDALEAEIEALRTEAEQHLQQAMSNGAKARSAQAQANNLRTEIEALRAEVAEWKRVAAAQAELHGEAEDRADKLEEELREAREFRDKLAKAIGNEQLRMFIEKHGEPVPLTLRVQAAEDRAERLAEALRRAHQWGGLGKGWDSGVALDLIAWIESGMEGELPPLPDYLAALAQEDRND